MSSEADQGAEQGQEGEAEAAPEPESEAAPEPEAAAVTEAEAETETEAVAAAPPSKSTVYTDPKAKPGESVRLTMVVPTLNEAEGIVPFLRQIKIWAKQLGGVEVVIMDDNSQDGTADKARAWLEESSEDILVWKVVVRGGEPGLSRAVIEGWREHARGEVLGVIDADLSHPPGLIPTMLAWIEDEGADVVVATRYMKGGGTEGWPFKRKMASRFATWLAKSVTSARDPLSGYLLFHRSVIEGVDLDPTGWKIGLEVLVRGKYKRLAEIPYVFKDRKAGESKFGGGVAMSYLGNVAKLRGYLAMKGIFRR